MQESDAIHLVCYMVLEYFGACVIHGAIISSGIIAKLRHLRQLTTLPLESTVLARRGLRVDCGYNRFFLFSFKHCGLTK